MTSCRDPAIECIKFGVDSSSRFSSSMQSHEVADAADRPATHGYWVGIGDNFVIIWGPENVVEYIIYSD